MKNWNIIGIGLTAIGAVITIAQNVIGNKQQEETIQKEVQKAIQNLKK